MVRAVEPAGLAQANGLGGAGQPCARPDDWPGGTEPNASRTRSAPASSNGTRAPPSWQARDDDDAPAWGVGLAACATGARLLATRTPPALQVGANKCSLAPATNPSGAATHHHQLVPLAAPPPLSLVWRRFAQLIEVKCDVNSFIMHSSRANKTNNPNQREID